MAKTKSEKKAVFEPGKLGEPVATVMSRASVPGHNLLSQVSIIIFLAFLISAVMIVAAISSPEFKRGLAAIGGFPEGIVSEAMMRRALFLDILFPVFYGAGLAGFAVAYQSRGNRPLVRAAVLAVLVSIFADFVENAQVFTSNQAGDGFGSSAQFIATCVKYASIAAASVIISVVFVPIGALGNFIALILRYVFPLSIAVIVSGVLGNLGRELVGVSFPVALVILWLYTRRLTLDETA